MNRREIRILPRLPIISKFHLHTLQRGPLKGIFTTITPTAKGKEDCPSGQSYPSTVGFWTDKGGLVLKVCIQRGGGVKGLGTSELI